MANAQQFAVSLYRRILDLEQFGRSQDAIHTRLTCARVNTDNGWVMADVASAYRTGRWPREASNEQDH